MLPAELVGDLDWIIAFINYEILDFSGVAWYFGTEYDLTLWFVLVFLLVSGLSGRKNETGRLNLLSPQLCIVFACSLSFKMPLSLVLIFFVLLKSLDGFVEASNSNWSCFSDFLEFRLTSLWRWPLIVQVPRSDGRRFGSREIRGVESGLERHLRVFLRPSLVALLLSELKQNAILCQHRWIWIVLLIKLSLS